MSVQLILRNGWRSMIGGDLAAVIGERVGETETHQPKFAVPNVNDPVLPRIPDKILFTASYQDTRYSYFLPEGTFKVFGSVMVGVATQHSAGKPDRQVVTAWGEQHSMVRSVFFAAWENRLDLMKEHKASQAKRVSLPLKRRLAPYERSILIEELSRQRGNRNRTAAALGISRSALHNKMQKYELLHFNFTVPLAG